MELRQFLCCGLSILVGCSIRFLSGTSAPHSERWRHWGEEVDRQKSFFAQGNGDDRQNIIEGKSKWHFEWLSLTTLCHFSLRPQPNLGRNQIFQ
jgi:hypothetical protein